MSTVFHTGDRVLARDRPWIIKQISAPSGMQAILKLEAIDGDTPGYATVISPPEKIAFLPNQSIEFDLNGLDSYYSWAIYHQILDTTSVREWDALSAVRYGRINLEAYQLVPALKILSKIRPSLLIADDVGLGKTIEAGLAVLEMMSRHRVSRVMVVTPPGLMEQWHDELVDKFNLDFKIIGNISDYLNAQTELPAGVSPWDALPHIITSLDFLKKDVIKNRALRKRWDLVIVDEAHALAVSGTPETPYLTQRTKLGLSLSKASHGILLLTATPHNGYTHSFRSLIDLIDPTLATFHGSRENVKRRLNAVCVRRMKSQIKRQLPDGSVKPAFPERHVFGVAISELKPLEKELLTRVSGYCSKVAKQALREKDDDAEIIGFAMQIIKKRALSSRAALANTLNYRLESLRNEEAREVMPSLSEIRELESDILLTESQAEKTAIKIIRSSIPREEKRRKEEIKAINGIRRLLSQLPTSDPKIETLIREIKRTLSEEASEKFIVFTEYRDTLEAIKSRFDQETDLVGRYVIFHGGLSRSQRIHREHEFEKPDKCILLATDAAGEGLNLQRFCHQVIHFELPWNPNRLEQRNGRVDRYGQIRETIIRYLYYPDSPEDYVLDTLVRKIEEMIRDGVSTPDIIGIFNRPTEDNLPEELTMLNPESTDIENQRKTLVVNFENDIKQYKDFTRPLMSLTLGDYEEKDITSLLNSTEPLISSDEELEEQVKKCLGDFAFKPDKDREGIYSIEVPVKFREQNVQPIYKAATFRRSVAINYRKEEVEFITPLHPLVQAISKHARSKFIQVYAPSYSPLAPRRLAAIAVDTDDQPSIIFTFYGYYKEELGRFIEEHFIAIRINVHGECLGNPVDNFRAFTKISGAGDVSPALLERLFAQNFQGMKLKATQEAEKWFKLRRDEILTRRQQDAKKLLEEIEIDAADRLREIEEEEKRERKLIEETGQQRLFPGDGSSGKRRFEVRKSLVEEYKKQKQHEIESYTRIAEPDKPQHLGALFIVPKASCQ